MEVLLYPYLPLNERQAAGPWELIPVRNFKAEDVNEPAQVRPIQGLIRMYRLPDGDGNLGVLARPRDGKVGDQIDRPAMATLGRAILLALLDTNPSFLTPEEERSGNEGHTTVTSDNAIGYGHPLDESGHIAVEYGALATTLVGGLDVHEQEGMIPFPPELRSPFLGRDVEPYCLDSSYSFLNQDNPGARRMAQTIDWLGVAWKNTVSLTPELRIVALKTAFEVLLDVGDGEEQQRQMLSSLLDAPDVERTTRTWTTLGGRERQADLSDLEWWFLQFTFLRNKIAHGDEIRESDFDFEDGRHHFWLADARLQAAIKELIARAGFPDLRLDYASRQIRSAYREAGVDPDTLESLDGGQEEGQSP